MRTEIQRLNVGDTDDLRKGQSKINPDSSVSKFEDRPQTLLPINSISFINTR